MSTLGISISIDENTLTEIKKRKNNNLSWSVDYALATTYSLYEHYLPKVLKQFTEDKLQKLKSILKPNASPLRNYKAGMQTSWLCLLIEQDNDTLKMIPTIKSLELIEAVSLVDYLLIEIEKDREKEES